MEPSSTASLVGALAAATTGADGGGCWAIAKDVALTVAACVGAYVALMGLGAWKRQLRGRSEYDLARRILRLCYEYRDAVAAARHPWMEIPVVPEDESGSGNPEQRRYRGTERAYEARWERIRSVRAELYPEMLEAEVLWDDQLAELFKPLFGLEQELFVAIEDELLVRDPDVNLSDKQHLRDPDVKKQRERTFRTRFRDTDEFDARFKDGLEGVGAFLKERLRR